MNGAEEAALRSGYLSEESKRKFTAVAGIVGAAFFVIQFMGPMLIMFAGMPRAMRSAFTNYAVDGAALYRGEVHLVEYAMGLGNEKQGPSKSRLMRIGRDGMHEVLPLQGWQPRLLADGDQLWLISSDRMARFDGARLLPLEVPATLGDISRPLLLDGAPAVVESRPEGNRLMRWTAEGWQEQRPLPSGWRYQALATEAGLLLLRQDGDTLYAQDAQTAARWDLVMAVGPWSWYAFMKDGKPAVASLSQEHGFRVAQYDGQRWASSAGGEVGRASHDGLAVFQERPGAPLIVMSEGFPGSLKLSTWDGQRLADERRLGRSSPFQPSMMLMMWLPQLGSMLLSAVLAVILSGLMRRHRVGVYTHDGTQVTHASLTRRALSQVVDALIMGLPAAALAWRGFSDFERMLEAGPGLPWDFFALIAASIAWIGFVLLCFIFSEGLWGVTPGKWLFGIRVIGTDLAPCGIGRALIRNVLKFVDGFFNYLVGILLVAYTQDWQRLGDLAARTIVIRTPGAGGIGAVGRARQLSVSAGPTS